MRSLVLADIHANLEALEAVLLDAAARGYDRILVLGDVVGYGASPNDVVERVQALRPAAIVRGNHDKVACGIDSAEGFNPLAKRAAEWTFETLTPEHRQWLAELPQGPRHVDDLIEICHGAPFDEDTYLFDDAELLLAALSSTRPLCLFGHTHHPTVFRRALPQAGTVAVATGRVRERPLSIVPGCTHVVNPGAVGQPRDGDPRAAYAIVDAARAQVELYRIPYAVEVAAAKVRRADLPVMLAERLTVGR